jgi:hypothetical protein
MELKEIKKKIVEIEESRSGVALDMSKMTLVMNLHDIFYSMQSEIDDLKARLGKADTREGIVRGTETYIAGVNIAVNNLGTLTQRLTLYCDSANLVFNGDEIKQLNKFLTEAIEQSEKR